MCAVIGNKDTSEGVAAIQWKIVLLIIYCLPENLPHGAGLSLRGLKNEALQKLDIIKSCV